MRFDSSKAQGKERISNDFFTLQSGGHRVAKKEEEEETNERFKKNVCAARSVRRRDCK